MKIRVGQGFDVHALVPGRRLVIGGVEIAHDRGLLGHSDADVLLHAITDAILGRSAITVASTLPILQPSRATRSTAARSSPRLSASL